jgi:3',5'-cyclic AMP phosphodiesterase CpdA
MFVLAHLSDPHLPPLPEARPHELIGKRVTGWLNWHHRRRFHHSAAVAEAVAADVTAVAPDHIAVTGDLGIIALPGEFSQGRRYLERLGTPDRVTVVPGNHDAYVRAGIDSFLSAWREYLTGDEPVSPAFPFLRRRGPVAMIGLSTAVPSPVLFATGRLGAQQLARFETLLIELGAQQCFRIVLIHHPPAGERSWLRILEDAAAFRAIIARHGAELILSGHDHISAVQEIPGPSGPIVVAQAPSASTPFADSEGSGGYNLYRIEGRPGDWSCELEARIVDTKGAVHARARRQLIGGIRKA